MDMSVFQLLLVTVFPLGVLPTSGPYDYRLITDKKSWPDAQAFCRAHYDDLATVANNVDLGRLQTEAQRLGFTSETWVGLYNDVNSWRCSRDEVPLGSWRNWEPSQPNNRFGKEQCASIKQDGLWYDSACSMLAPFVCYDETIISQDKSVLYMNQNTWKEAQNYCRQKHTDLACPSNEAENEIIKNKVSNTWTWTGFYRDAWKWSDKTNDSDIKWSPYQPDNARGRDNCGYVVSSVFGSGGTSGGWFDDADCSHQCAFFCQYVQKKKQVIRLVVQSNQDVTDPAVKAALLEKIQQKLAEQGMVVNATLQWKEQSNGTVFHKQKESENNPATTCEV